jgi:aryl-alcohol dehydrogenase-like predicted oxidoreductase
MLTNAILFSPFLSCTSISLLCHKTKAQSDDHRNNFNHQNSSNNNDTMKLFAKFAKANQATHPNAGIGYGCMGISFLYGAAMEEDAAMETLKTVYDHGCRHFDTAEIYHYRNDDPNKHNEKVLGRFLNTVPRDSYSVATKYWPENNFSAYDYETVKAHLVQSLERLQLEYVDLYYAHRVTSLEGGKEFAKAANRLKQEGLIKEVGLSEVSGNWLEIIHTEGGPVDAVQQEWSILTRSLEDELVPVCKANDITIVAYSPLCRNLLVQKLEAPPADWRADLPRYKNYQQNKKFADQIHEMAEALQATPAQVCLAWILQKAAQLGVSVVPIPGTTKSDRAIGNIEAVDVTLSSEHMLILDGMAKDVVGERYEEVWMKNGLAIESQ